VTVRFTEFKEIVNTDAELLWGLDPRGQREINISTESNDAGVLQPSEGFTILGVDHFFMCYEFYEGIAIHTDKFDVAVEKIRKIAGALESNVFFLN